MLILNTFKGQVLGLAKQRDRKLNLVIIPAEMTSQLQVLERVLNKHF